MDKLTILTLICQAGMFIIVFLNILWLHNIDIFNFIHDIGSIIYLLIFFINLTYFHYHNINLKKSETDIITNDRFELNNRISKIKQLISDKKIIIIFIAILLTLININTNDREWGVEESEFWENTRGEQGGEGLNNTNTTVNMGLNNNWTIIILTTLIIVFNLLKIAGLDKFISIYNVDYLTLGVFLIFIIQNIFLDDIKTYILLSIFIVYPLFDSFIILRKKPNSQHIYLINDFIKILSEYSYYNKFLTSIPVVLLGIIILLMKVFKDCTDFNLVIGNVFLILIALYHIISTLYIFDRNISKIRHISEYISKFENMMIICLNEKSGQIGQGDGI